jgi:hypothetical protein
MSDHPELTSLLKGSADLLQALDTTLTGAQFDDSVQASLALATSDLAIEHGVSVCVLVETGHLASANVLLRTQFEAASRAIWIAFAATPEWLEKYFAAASANPKKDPNVAPGMDDMLRDIALKAPAPIAPQLTALKRAAWGALNSFVHSGIHPTTLKQAGYPLDGALATVCNANALTTMAFATMAALTADPDVMKRLSELQSIHRACLPPPIPTPPSV